MLWGPAEYSVWGALKEHFVDRGIHGMHHAQPWWYYAKVLPPQLLPWTFLVPGALVLAWRRRDRTDRFLLVTVIFVVLFFSISTEKRTLYVLPGIPRLCSHDRALRRCGPRLGRGTRYVQAVDHRRSGSSSAVC